jgi:hypothetical protein
VIEKSENNYSAYVPDLPGCIATGATAEEAEQLIREAIELDLIGPRGDGFPLLGELKWCQELFCFTLASHVGRCLQN